MLAILAGVFERVLHSTQGHMIVSYVIGESIVWNRVSVPIALDPKKGLSRDRKNAVITDHSRDRDQPHHQRTISFQRHILGSQPGSARSTAGLRPQPGPTVPGRPLSISLLPSEQSSDAARPGVTVQRCVDCGHPSPSSAALQSVHDSTCWRYPSHVPLYLLHPRVSAPLPPRIARGLGRPHLPQD